MAITAKVRCTSRVQLDSEQDLVHFGADYYSGADDANAEWARYTPALSLQMNVRRDVLFKPGVSYTLTFEPDTDA